MAASWGHPMGGYDAGYYTYLWSKVYGDDMGANYLVGCVQRRHLRLGD